MIAAVILAAGLARRMGARKLLLDLGGKPVIRRTVEAIEASGIDDVLVVTGPQLELGPALAGTRARLVVNPAPEAGQSTSIAAGVRALRPGTEALVIVLGDQPGLPSAVIARLVEAWRGGGKPIVVPVYSDGRGNPVLFAASVFAELERLGGDRGARELIEADPGRVERVVVDRPMPEDIDTPADYERVRRSFERRTGGVH